MPFKTALAIALAAVLTPLVAATALAAPPGQPSAPSAHKVTRPKSRPASTKVVPVGKRKHTVDAKPDAHAPAIAMSKPLDAPKVDSKAVDSKKADMKKPVGKKRQARKAEAKKSDAKKGDDKQAVPVVAAAITTPLPPLPPPGKMKAAAGPCLHPPIDMVRGTEVERFSLTTCDGTVAPNAIERLSTLLRPSNAAGTSRVDSRLVERLGLVTEHFAKGESGLKVSVVSGYRPSSAGSYHASGRAIDFRIDGVKNEEIVAFCKRLTDTGCGYYPNCSFVHLDVRDPGTGHVAWIDASGPGEAPRYVASWPPPADETHQKKDARAMIDDLLATLEKELPRVPTDDHPAEAPKADNERE